jgi:glycosyltransferase involved in cell wall biosynthesis
MKKKLLVEGWRGINHSYAMVNQQQLLHLVRSDELQVFHRDLPFFNPGWSVGHNGSGLSAAQREQLNAIPPLQGAQPDVVYRIAYPYRNYGADSRRVFCFGTSEYQNLDGMLYDGPESKQRFSHGAATFITPSHWSREGFLRQGFREEDVAVVPHGVAPEVYKPMAPADRLAARKGFGLADDSFVFLSVGAMTWNKGIDKLLRAFSVVNQKWPTAVLALKDQSNLYGINARDLVETARNEHPSQFPQQVLSKIAILSNNLTVDQLSALYNISDAYVSPYRAEGFNLTPLEAAACGLPVILTGGGATDDYYDSSFALRIAGKPSVDGNNRFIEPDLDSLIAAMLELLEGRAQNLDRAAALSHITENFSWKRVTDKLIGVLCE